MPGFIHPLKKKSCLLFYQLMLFVLVGCVSPASTSESDHNRPLFSFGIVTDAQYADKDPAGLRHYRASLENLGVAAKEFNARDLKFVVHLGDLIDENFSSYVIFRFIPLVWRTTSGTTRKSYDCYLRIQL